MGKRSGYLSCWDSEGRLGCCTPQLSIGFGGPDAASRWWLLFLSFFSVIQAAQGIDTTRFGRLSTDQ